MTNSPLAGASTRPLASACPEQTAAAIVAAAHDLLGHLAAGRRINAPAIRTAIQSAFGASDASGAWDWKAAYEAVEVAQLLFIRRYGPAIHTRTADPFERLKLVERIARLAPTQTRRSEEMQAYQQFSTPLGLAWVAGLAAGFRPGELVLEPSAGTGLLAVQAELAGCRLALNEVAELRAALLGSLFEGLPVSMHDAAQIHDRLDADLVPSCIVMNPPFSTAPHVETRVADAAYRHLSSAIARLAEGGRLVAITGANCAPDHKAWRDGFVRLQERARVVFTATISGSVFAPHGTSVETRLTVIDKVAADDATQFPASPGIAPDLATLLRWLIGNLPPRLPVAVSELQPLFTPSRSPAARLAVSKPQLVAAPAAEPWRKRGKLVATGTKRRRRCARHFVEFLRGRGVIPSVEPVADDDPHMSAYLTWLKQHRGATDETIRRYRTDIRRLMPMLGEPSQWDAAGLRSAFQRRSKETPGSASLLVTIMRSYIRFLVVRGECRPALLHAVPSVQRYRLSTLPRHVDPATIERIIAACPTDRPVEVRDKAIILLLARLGLRAADVQDMRLDDIDWRSGHLTVKGKTRRPDRLPLPQDVGDAILAYLAAARPEAAEEHLFLRAQAPFRPFRSSAEIAGIVARTRDRGGIEGVPTGSHIFRHSLATNLLRAGAGLESVGTILRHSSPETTAIYAKVDLPMLMKIAQPWPGEPSC